MIIANPFLSAKAISEKISEKDGTNERTIERDLAKLKKRVFSLVKVDAKKVNGLLGQKNRK